MLFDYKYGGNTSVNSTSQGTSMSFAPDVLRHPTFFVGKLNKKISFREAISALHDVVVSDLRFKPKDRTEYLAWAAEQEKIWLSEYIAQAQIEEVRNRINALKDELDGIYKVKNKILAPFYDARSKYFKYLYDNDKDAWFVLDPVITVHPDELFFECFSQDESTYGKLSCSYNVFKEINEFECGTTNIDYSATLYGEFQKIRNYKDTDFKIDPSGFEVQTSYEETYKEVKIDLPDSWVRGFLQVSAAMTLPATSFNLHPMDVYTICQYLRRFKEKEGPRALRFVLEPGQPIKVVFEPWYETITFHRSVYTGNKADTIRIWGRRRLLILERLIPITKTFTVMLLGSGLPSFFLADLGDMTFTLGLSGWTANDWSRAGNFDLMAPRANVDFNTQKLVFDTLKSTWYASSHDLIQKLNLEPAIIASSLTSFAQAGKLIYDPHLNVYRIRELSGEPLDMDKLRFSSEQERIANILIDRNYVEIKVEEANNCLNISGTVKDQRTYNVTAVIDSDERLIKGSCQCNFYRSNELKKGPCEHILAARILGERR